MKLAGYNEMQQDMIKKLKREQKEMKKEIMR